MSSQMINWILPIFVVSQVNPCRLEIVFIACTTDVSRLGDIIDFSICDLNSLLALRFG